MPLSLSVPLSLSYNFLPLNFFHRITIFHTLQHVLGFSNLSNLNAVFLTSPFYFVFPFLKTTVSACFYQCLMNISWLVWGGSVLLKSSPKCPHFIMHWFILQSNISVSEFYSFWIKTGWKWCFSSAPDMYYSLIG